MDLHYVCIYRSMPVPLGCHTLSVWCSATVYSDESKVQHNTTLLSLCREICLLARHLHKTFNTFNNKTTQWNTEIKTAQIQGKCLTITMYTRTHGGMHAPTPPPPPPPPPPTHTHRHTNKTTTDHFISQKAPKSRYKSAKQILLITATVN